MDETVLPGAGSHDELSAAALPAHLYIHVPFCSSKCSYCDFFSITDVSDERIEPVRRGLDDQIARWAELGLPGMIETMYIGGGTPTVLTTRLVELLRIAFDAFDRSDRAEVTVEANPDSLTSLLVESLAEAGATRISLGVQSFDARELALLGRAHTVDDALIGCEAVRMAGMDLSVDLMCGIPGQSVDTWLESLEQVLTTGARHVSVYPLTLEEGTPLQSACSEGRLRAPDPDLTATLMRIAEECLQSAGLRRYEVANYAVPGHESRHNLAYWTSRQYIGIGPSAHGMLDVPTAIAAGVLDPEQAADASRVRYSEADDLDEWLAGAGGEVELLSAAEAAREDVMLELRLTRGTTIAQVERANLMPVMEDLESLGLIERGGTGEQTRFRTTSRGWLLGNEVFSRVWAGV